MLRTLKGLAIPVLVGLSILALVGLLGSGLVLYREASAVHPALGWLVVALLLAGLVLLVFMPIVQVIRLPGTIVRPPVAAGPRWERYVRRYARRLTRNKPLREGYAGFKDLQAAVDRGASPDQLEIEVTRALEFLDTRVRDIAARHAAAVFAATAVSQSGRLDTLIVISAQLRMLQEIAIMYYQRPRPRELWNLYLNVGATAFVAGELQDSEVLAVLGAPLTAGLTGLVSLPGSDPLVSLLVASLLDGSANAFLTLRIGALGRRHCGLRLDGDRRLVARSASLEAATLLAGVVGAGAARLAALTRKLLVEAAVQGTQRAARGVAGAGAHLVQKIAQLAEKAADSSTAGLRYLQESLTFWETVAETAEDGGSQTPTQAAEERPAP
jgi:Domain of unknown function (DUF697)